MRTYPLALKYMFYLSTKEKLEKELEREKFLIEGKLGEEKQE